MTVFTNIAIFDGTSSYLKKGFNVVVSGDCIKEVTDRPPNPDDGDIIDGEGCILMPGLIDAHIHAYASDVNLTRGMSEPPTLYSHFASSMLSRMLDRGFTSVRDTGGADYGLFLAIERGYFNAPRLFYCEKALSMTGGHADFRHHRHHNHNSFEDGLCCGCGSVNHLGIVVDGIPQVLRAVRENLRRGSSFIKFMGSGGISSPADSVSSIQFSDPEVRAIVEEVERHELYCTAHIHPDRALKRAINLGVHCIEHGTLIEPETARMAADRGTNIVPTLAIIAGLGSEGEKLGYPPESLKKLEEIKDKALTHLQFMKTAGVRLGFGTDLLGKLEYLQCTEFTLRSSIFSNFEILHQATAMNAEIIGQKDKLGVIKPGAYADILLVNGNPLDDLNLCTADGANFPLIMKSGKIHKSTLRVVGGNGERLD